ncbi:hypothetical protein EPO56_00675 [Patescibacteria group bacterium]|nr:MAG: hypothetical protein EPO56_00675 [Patescibacteria group bacterium]
MQKAYTWVFIGILFIGFGGAAYYYYPGNSLQNNNGQACTEEAKMCPDGSSVSRVAPSCNFTECPTPEFHWVVSDAGTTLAGTPLTNASLKVGGREYQLGQFSGSCAEIEGEIWKFAEGEKAGLVCWFAGGGVEIGVFEEDGRLVIKRGQVDEGSAEVPGTRGPFEFVQTIGDQ